MGSLGISFYVLCFIALYMFVEGVYYTFAREAGTEVRKINKRLKRYASRLQAADLGDLGSILLQPEEGSIFTRLLKSIPIPRRRTIELFLYRAGMPFNLTQFLTLIGVLSVGGPALAIVVMAAPTTIAALSLLGLTPIAYVSYLKRKRMSLFENQFPEALELLSRSLRVGHSLSVGFEMVGDELPDPMGAEFGHVADEISLGMETPTALRNLAHRMNISDMPFFINAVMIQRETGGNLAEILDNLGLVVRQRIQFYGRVRGLLKQGKLNANLLAMIPVLLLVAIRQINPDYVEPLFSDPMGRGLLVIAGVGVALGYFLCRRIADVKF